MVLELLDRPNEHKLRLDEKVEWIWERDEGGRWRQHIQLVRDGRMRHFIADMGSIIAHPLWKPFNFWAGGEYSVGECLEIAERARNNKEPEDNEPLDLAQSYLKLIEEKRKRRDRMSTFGRYINRQRG